MRIQRAILPKECEASSTSQESKTINREAGKANDMSSVIIAVPTKTLSARQYQYEAYFPSWLCWRRVKECESAKKEKTLAVCYT